MDDASRERHTFNKVAIALRMIGIGKNLEGSATDLLAAFDHVGLRVTDQNQ